VKRDIVCWQTVPQPSSSTQNPKKLLISVCYCSGILLLLLL